MSDRSEQIDAILAEAVELPHRDARDNFIRNACGGDYQLQRQVEELVDAYLSAGDFLESPASQLPPTIDLGLAESAGNQLGRYKLLQQIGEGGFAVVFMAEQEQPVRRRVAVKIIKPGMDSRQVIARFEAERQALAMMDHSNIAKVLDAGTTESGRPYFVMELVKGTPITDYCDEHRLSIDERLALFSQVCDAVQHAHQKGVIHRDIKPSNVLVRTEDDKPLVKVIDFGIAKATETRLTDMTLFTEFRQLIGTPAYMSPEQVEGSLDIDTRSDVYSLGVLLYELLSGSPPFDPKDLKSKAVAEMQRIIREVDPPTPSTRLNTLDAGTRVTKARARGYEPDRLTQHLRGELDWIVLRAMEKDRNRRYRSAAALADDIERYVTNEPVEARPATAGYRFRKFVRRNKGLLATLGAVAIVLVGATALSTWQAIRASRAEKQAIADSRRAEAVTDFLVQAFRTPDPDRDGRSVTIVEVLERAVGEVNTKFADDPLLKAALLDALSKTYSSLGLYEKSLPLAKEAFRIRQNTSGESRQEMLSSMGTLSAAYARTGNYSEAKELVEKELKLRRAEFGKGDDKTAETIARLLIVDQLSNAPQNNVPLSLRIEELIAQEKGLGEEKILQALFDAAVAEGNRQIEGVGVSTVYSFRDILEACQKKLGENHHLTISVMFDVGVGEYRHNNVEKAREIWQQTLKLQIQSFGTNDRNTVRTIEMLAELFSKTNAGDPQARLQEIDALATIAPENSSVRIARKKILARIRPANETVDEFVELIQNAQDQAWSNSPRKTTCRELAELPELFEAVALRLPDEQALWIGRGQFHILRNQLDAAERDYARVIRQRSLQDEHFEYGSILLLRGDMPGYQAFCRETLQRNGDPPNSYIAYVAARLYGLGPADCVEPAQLLKWAEDGAHNRQYWQLQTLGVGYLRTNKNEQAVAVLKESLTSSGADSELAESWFSLAIAHHRLGNNAESRHCLDQGRLILKAVQPAEKGAQLGVEVPSSWLSMSVMAREAEALLNPSSTIDTLEIAPASK